MRNVALDLGAKKIAFCEVSEGTVVNRATVTSLLSLEPMLGPQAAPTRVAIEACREAWFVHAHLTKWGNEVLVIDTTRSAKLGIGQHGRKNDRIDAEVMARAVERGGIPLAHVLSPHRRELRRALGVRRALVETRTQYIVTVRGLVREQGERVPTCASDHFLAHVRKATLGDKVRATIEPLVSTLEPVEAQLAEVEQRLVELCSTEPAVALLMTAPGVGPIIAASFVSVIDDAHRFRNAHQVESYLGLVPSEDSSGGKRRLGAISKQGNSYLRSVLVQGAWGILRGADPSDPLRQWGNAIAKRRGKSIAVIALARRLAGVLWAMWRDDTAYDPALVARAGARGLRLAAQQTEFRATALERAAVKLRRQIAQPKRPKEVSSSR
jgi:transposase